LIAGQLLSQKLLLLLLLLLARPLVVYVLDVTVTLMITTQPSTVVTTSFRHRHSPMLLSDRFIGFSKLAA